VSLNITKTHNGTLCKKDYFEEYKDCFKDDFVNEIKVDMKKKKNSSDKKYTQGFESQGHTINESSANGSSDIIKLIN
jgi:hypothetical protein